MYGSSSPGANLRVLMARQMPPPGHLAQFYRKAYLRWIDATVRKPGLRAARIAEVVQLLAAGIRQRPRPRPSPEEPSGK
jgi:hypothetical protein